ncbi:hypothetical protein BTR14_13190 [Rhizobium rhizosphaerae]|uniref:Uncharacterized protein n=1 Tax=Xaviernesmea rhizosphaerae TaxID=1672749 RepID=A0ABX3PDA2_9HYPH|nr:hypothetical protein [Xaviernesmea rhizosphaerae]OQP86032.1 hypothetical protein BTR14_13190 [Xaviernesmea rhizosphaerae]
MNEAMNNTVNDGSPSHVPTANVGFSSDDHVQRAKSIVLTVWMALNGPDIVESDTRDVSETLYEAYEHLRLALAKLGGAA